MNRSLLFSLATALLLTLVACANEPAAQAQEGAVTHELTGTRWVLVQLAGQPVAYTEGQREIFIALSMQAQRISGDCGCNRLNGGYRLDGSNIEFTAIAMTRMACADEAVSAREAAVTEVLAAARRWRIEGDQLEFSDTAGASLARFKAINL